MSKANPVFGPRVESESAPFPGVRSHIHPRLLPGAFFMPTPGRLVKRCSKCHEDLPLDRFYRRGNGHQGYCKGCDAKYQRARQLATRYGITPLEADGLLFAQGNRCAICKRSFTESLTPVVDHCHASLRVRSLLCHNCNLALGHMADDIERLASAISYLEQHGQASPTR